MAALSLVSCSPGREAPRTLRERLECSEGGNTGRRTREPYRARARSRTAVRSAPGRGRAEAGLIRGLVGKASITTEPARALLAPVLVASWLTAIVLTSLPGRYFSRLPCRRLFFEGQITADDDCVGFPGPGQPGRRNGQGSCRCFHSRASGLRGDRCRFGAEPQRHDLERSGRNPHADRKRPAGADGGFDRGFACA